MRAMQNHRFRLGSILCTQDGASSLATGIVTERDYITKVASKSLDPRSVRCSQVLTKPVMCAPAGTSIMEGAQLLSQQRIRHLPVLDDAAAVGARDAVPLSSILGMLSVKDFLRFIHSTHGNWPTPNRRPVEITVQDLLSHQPKPVVVMSPTEKVLDAVKQMAAVSTGVVMVQDSSQTGFRGIMTERDVIFKVELLGKSTADTAIGDIMTTDPVVASPSFSWESVIELMVTGSRDGRLFRHLPVVQSDGRRMSRTRCLGVITVRQLLAVWLKKIAAEQ
jgi:CBS domain-containing protein